MRKFPCLTENKQKLKLIPDKNALLMYFLYTNKSNISSLRILVDKDALCNKVGISIAKPFKKIQNKVPKELYQKAN